MALLALFFWLQKKRTRTYAQPRKALGFGGARNSTASFSHQSRQSDCLIEGAWAYHADPFINMDSPVMSSRPLPLCVSPGASEESASDSDHHYPRTGAPARMDRPPLYGVASS
ncbi:hypothetical protein C8J57DRAFT_1298972 [Mycena rebaudengoi]|nr:hypothetical protein C8J57DRAFT_1298972 [Mycena rebaudengoi]